MKPEPKTDYEHGYVDGMRAYAWWKDGEQYVGTCGATLAAAIDLFLASRRRQAKTPELPAKVVTPEEYLVDMMDAMKTGRGCFAAGTRRKREHPATDAANAEK
jgi:hypothetical protein